MLLLLFVVKQVKDLAVFPLQFLISLEKNIQDIVQN